MTDVRDRLDEALLEETEPRVPHQHEGWRIRDDDEAAWVSRKAQKAHRELARVDAWEEREIARIRAVAARERTPFEREVEWAEGQLHVWLDGLIREGRNKKSMELPGGRVAVRSRPPRLEIDDEDTAVGYLRGTEYVRIKESLDRVKLRKALATDGTTVYLAETGERVPWAHMEPQEDSVTFTPAEDDDA